jgi:DUF971 family protein
VTRDGAARPSALRLRKGSRVLELDYPDGQRFSLSWEYLRVNSPSAEVRGHHPAQAVLQTGKKHVGIEEIRPVGHYAIQIIFDDGHDSGLYSWDYLLDLCRQQPERWAAYLRELDEAGASRDPDTQVVRFSP